MLCDDVVVRADASAAAADRVAAGAGRGPVSALAPLVALLLAAPVRVAAAAADSTAPAQLGSISTSILSDRLKHNLNLILFLLNECELAQL